MAYIGRSPLSGEVILMDSIESQFNGSTTEFNLTRTISGSQIDFIPVTSSQLLVSLGGVIQKPDRTANEGFKIDYNKIVFAVAPPAGASCFIVSYGNVLDVGTPATATVTPEKLSTGGPTWDTSGNVTINSDYTIGSTSVTTTSTSAQTLFSFSASTYRTVECTIQVTKGTDYHSTKLMIIHDGTDTYVTEYGTVFSNTSLATFSSDISSGNIIVTATPGTVDSTTFKIYYNMLKS